MRLDAFAAACCAIPVLVSVLAVRVAYVLCRSGLPPSRSCASGLRCLIVLGSDSIEDRADFEPKQWWGTHGVSTRLLKNLALKVLGQPASSSCCERNWSTYGFIHSAARNKLTPARAADLVYTHNNHRLLSRNSQAYQTGPSRMWDVGGDGVETFAGVGMLESADLSLDEPELEEEIIGSLT